MTPRVLGGRLLSLLRRSRRDAELEEELRLHVDLAAQELERQGIAREEAQRRARIQIGGVERTRGQVHDAAGFVWLDTMWQDLRYACRMARRQPGWSSVVVLSVALGIGANTAIASLVEAVLVRPLTYREPDRLAVIRVVVPDLAGVYPSLPANGVAFTTWKERVTAFEGLSLIDPRTETMTGLGTPERVEVARVSTNLFSLLGTPVALGRDFTAAEEREGNDRVVILSHGFWRSRFGGDPSAIGGSLSLNGKPCTIVGVQRQSFRFPRGGQLGALVTLPPNTQVFRPMALTEEERTSWSDFDFAAIGRLKPGVTFPQATSEIDAAQAEVVKLAGIPGTMLSAVVPLQEQMVGDARRGLVVLAAAVGAVLLLLSVNLAGLLLARSTDREREAAIRTALGASRRRVLRQLVFENLVLAVAGGVLGILLAGGLLSVMTTQMPVDLPRVDEIRLSGTGVAVAAALTLLTGVLFSLMPALRLSAAPPRAALAAGGRSLGAGTATARLRGALVSGQVALSTVLLVVAGLLVTSFVRLVSVPRGFDTEHIVLATVEPSPADYEEDARRIAFFDRLLGEFRSLPGLGATAMVSYAPLKGEGHVHTMTREHDTTPITLRPTANIRYVSPGYFAAMGIRITRGRDVSEADRGRLVMIVNDRMAQALWPGEDPIGKRVHQGDEEKPVLEVVGTVADTREVALRRDPVLMGYVPYFGRRVPQSATLVMRTNVDPASLAPAIRATAWKVDGTLPPPEIRSLRQVADDAVSPERFQMLLVGVFAVSALLLAALGIYGVPSYVVARRTQELGLRLALGASPSDLQRLVIGQGLRPVALGLLLGLVGALAVGRFVAGLLFDVTPYDLTTLVSVVAVIGVVAVVACYVPARRATRIEPMSALRFE